MDELLQRYTWEDELIDAQVTGVLPAAAVNVALRLAKQINWNPTKAWRKEPGLYWKNEDACRSVGIGRSTFYRHRESLIDAGFFKVVSGNLHPRLPSESQEETRTSEPGTKKSEDETPKSQGDQPLSEDLFSDDLLSDDEWSEPPAEQGWKPGLPLTSSWKAKNLSNSNEIPLEDW